MKRNIDSHKDFHNERSKLLSIQIDLLEIYVTQARKGYDQYKIESMYEKADKLRKELESKGSSLELMKHLLR